MKKNILLTLILSLLIFILWQFGGKVVYAQILKAGMNIITANISSIKKVEITYDASEPIFRFKYDKPKLEKFYSTKYCMSIIVLISWQIILLAFNQNRKLALKMALQNIGIMYLIHILFPILILSKNASPFNAMVFFILLQGINFCVLFLIIKDSIIVGFKKKTVGTTNLK
jgi:hypothetical protein